MSCLFLFDFRTAIEEELEVLYDAYYDELESYANHQVRYASSGGTIAPPPGPGPFPGSVDSVAAAPTPPNVKDKKSGGIVKTTRDHKNVRPAMKKKVGMGNGNGNNQTQNQNQNQNNHQNQNNNTNHNHNPNSNHNHNHSHDTGPAHGEPGHTHSQSCPHHPHNHSHAGAPATAAAKAKGAVVVEQETYDDENGTEEGSEEDEEYDEDEYDEEDEEEEVSYNFGFRGRCDRANECFFPQYEDDESNAQAQEEANKKPLPSTKKDNDGADFFGFGKSLTVKGM